MNTSGISISNSFSLPISYWLSLKNRPVKDLIKRLSRSCEWNWCNEREKRLLQLIMWSSWMHWAL